MTELRGIPIDDPERAKAVVLGALLGEKRRSKATELVLSVLPADSTKDWGFVVRPEPGFFRAHAHTYADGMAKRRGTSGDLVKMWSATIVVLGASAWLLSQSTVVCEISGPAFGGGAGRCIATSIAHGLAPYLPWVMAIAAVFAIIATLAFAPRGR